MRPLPSSANSPADALASGICRFCKRADDLRLDGSAKPTREGASHENSLSNSGGLGGGVRVFSARYLSWSRRIAHEDNV